MPHVATTATADKATIDAIPTGPSAHGIAAPGNAAKNRAVPATIDALVPATATGAAASQGTAANGTAIVPRMVMGATSGPASTLAMSE